MLCVESTFHGPGCVFLSAITDESGPLAGTIAGKGNEDETCSCAGPFNHNWLLVDYIEKDLAKRRI